MSFNIDELPLPRKVKVLHWDPNLGLLALDKPVNFKSHPNKSGEIEKSTLLMAPYDLKQECYKTSQGPVYLLNRLDSPTSGVILLATQMATAKEVKRLFKERKVNKTYEAVVSGKIKQAKGTWEDKLAKEGRGSQVRSGVGGDLTAKTDFEVIEYLEDFNLTHVRLFPKTGRTHQLRVQAASRRHPIVGDKTYGDFNLNKQVSKFGLSKRLYLHAKEVEFELQGQSIKISSVSCVF